jgi:hypothetical protein
MGLISLIGWLIPAAIAVIAWLLLPGVHRGKRLLISIAVFVAASLAMLLAGS